MGFSELLETGMTFQNKQKSSRSLPKIVVLGIGNLLLKDEGVGIHLINLLRETSQGYPNVELIDAGTSVDIPDIVSGVDKLIILDAVAGGNTPGTIYHFDIDQIQLERNSPLSLHEMGVLDSLRMLTLTGERPKSVTIIGVEPKLIDWGMELSPEIQDKLPQILKLIYDEIDKTSRVG